MSFGSGKLYNTSNRFSPRRGRSRNERDNDNNNGSPMPRWHASLSPERSSTTRSSRYQNNNNNLNESNMGNNNDNNNNPYYHVSERYQQPNSSNLNTSKSLDDEIISFLNSSPRPESFQTRRLVESEENTNNNGWGGTSRIYKNNNNNNDEEQEETFYNDGDSFLNEIRQEDESLYQMDQTLLNSHGSGGVTSASVRYGGIQSEEDNNNSSPEHGSPQRQGNSSRSKSQQRSRQNQATHTIYSTSASPHIKKRRERYLSNNRSRNTHPYNASSIVSAYSSSNSMNNNNNKKKKKNTKKQQRSNSNKKISLKQQRMKDAALSMSKHNANNSTRNTSRRSFSKNNNNNNSKKKGQSSRRRMNRLSIKQQSTVISGTTIVKKKKKKKKKLVSSSTTNQSQLILDRSAAPVLPPSPQRLKKAKGKIEAWSKDANNISTTSSRKIYRIPSSKYNKKSKKLDRPSSAGARLSNRYKFDEDDENFLNKKIKTITKQKKNIKSLKLRKRGMEQSIAALQKEIEARDLHIKELRNIIKRKERELVVAKGAKATEAVNTSGILNLSTDSIRSVGSQSYRERKNVTKLERTQQKMKSEIKELRRREQRAVEIHGALRNTIDKLRNEKDAFGDQIDDLKSTIRSLKRSLEAERQYNKELIRTEFGENEAMNLQEEKINSHGSNNKVTNRILRQEISRLKSLLDVSRGKVKNANNELNHFKSENDHLKNENNDLKVQLKNIKMKDRLLNKEIEAVKDSKEKKKVVKVVIGGDSGKKNKNATSPIAKLMQKKIDDDKANLSKYQRLKSMYDRVQGGGGSNQ